MLSSPVLLNSDSSSEIQTQTDPVHLKLKAAQQQLYDFFLKIINHWTVDRILFEFEQLFVHLTSSCHTQIVEGLNRIVVEQDETLFRETLKRCLYILINNWRINRDYGSAQQLIQTLDSAVKNANPCISPSINCVRTWLYRFIQSPEYQEIQQFALSQPQGWTQRYQSYLLIPPTLKTYSSKEQQKAALELAQKIQEKYKFDLAMYITRSESRTALGNSYQNPTQLGNAAITLIKQTLSSQKILSYEYHAKLFLEKIQNTRYHSFKLSLLKYLHLWPENPYPSSYIREKFSQKLDRLESNYKHHSVDKSVVAMTCQQLIQLLTTENDQNPSRCFTCLISQKQYLTLVILLVKIVFLSRSSKNHLEQKIANLIHFYKNLEEEKCHKFIQFMEVFNLVFTVFTTNLQFHLVKAQSSPYQPCSDLDQYRLFCQLKGPDLRNANLKTANLSNRDLSGADLRGTDLRGLEFIRADLRLANLSQANLSQSVFNEAHLPIANLIATNLTEASLNKANLRRANLQQANLTQACLTSARLEQANLSQAQLKKANLMAACLKRADLRNADLSGANLESADLRQVDLSGANLKGANLKGANLWNANLFRADLRETNLSQTHLDCANLSYCNLFRANLTQAELKGANLSHSNLNQANFQQADGMAANLASAALRRTDFTEASFSQANFSQSDLTRANLQKADLSGANLSQAYIRHAILQHTNLSDVNFLGANLFGSDLKQAIIQNAQFGENSGLSEEIKSYLKTELAFADAFPATIPVTL